MSYPRLTTSNLRDEATSKCAARLSTFEGDDDAATISQWSKPPQLHKPPTKAVIVNYSDNNFPSLPSKKARHKNNKQQNSNQKSEEQNHQNETSSHQSKGSAISTGTTGTTFTREDGVSLFTTLTESFMEESKNQTQQMLLMIQQQNQDRKEEKVERLEQQRIQNAERLEQQRIQNETNTRLETARLDQQRIQTEQQQRQTETNARMETRFEKMLQAFITQATIEDPRSTTAIGQPKDPTEFQTPTKKKKKKQQPTSMDTGQDDTNPEDTPTNMDESIEADKHSTSVATSSNDESSGPSHQQAEPNYLDNWDDSKSASFTSTSFHCHDLDEHTSGSETSTLYHNTPQGHTRSDSDIINSDASKDSDTKDSETHDDAGSFGTIDSDDPIHEEHEKRIRDKHQARSAGLALWLERTRPIVKLSTKDATAAIARTHHRITEFFTPKGPPNPTTPHTPPPEEIDSENLVTG